MDKKIILSQNGEFVNYDGKHYGGNQNDFPEKEYREKGCAVIAAANLIYYIGRSNKDFFKKSSENNLNDTDYDSLCGKIKKILPPDANGIKLCSVFKMLTGNKLKYCPAIFNSKNKLLGLTEKALSENIPVIVSVFYLSGNKNKGFEIYGSDGNYIVRAHYMTVTGIISDAGKVSVILSSWGKRFTMDLNGFYENARKNPANMIGSGIFIPLKK